MNRDPARPATHAHRKALVIHGNPEVRASVRAALEPAGFVILESDDGELGFALSVRERPAIAVLDLELPGLSGIELCRRLRSDGRTARLPIVVATTRDAETDRVVAFEMGADIYVTTPFPPREFLARVKAVVNRVYAESSEAPREVYQRGGLRVDFDSYEVDYRGQPIQLRLIEFELLKFFLLHPNRAYDRSRIIEFIWGRDTHVDRRTVDQHVMRLRRRIEDRVAARLIVSVRGIGYMFDERLLVDG